MKIARKKNKLIPIQRKGNKQTCLSPIDAREIDVAYNGFPYSVLRTALNSTTKYRED
jgi:hypothetical protein